MDTGIEKRQVSDDSSLFLYLNEAGQKANHNNNGFLANELYGQANEYFDTLLADPSMESGKLIEFLCRYAKSLSECTRHQEAYNKIKQALGLVSDGNYEIKARVLQVQGYVCRALGYFSESEKSYLEALECYRTLGNENQEAYVIHHLSTLYERMGNTKAAIRYTRLLVKQAKKAGLEINRLEHLARIAVLKYQYIRARNCLESLLERLEIKKAENTPLGYRCRKKLGALLFYLGDFKRARAIFLKNCSNGRDPGIMGLAADALIWLGRLAQVEGNLHSAEIYATESEKVLARLENSFALCQARALLANIHAIIGDHDQAMTWAKVAQASVWEEGLVDVKVFVWRCIGQALAATGSCQDAENAFLQATNKHPATGAEWALALLATGEFYLCQGQSDLAKKYLTWAAGACRELGMIYFENQANKRIAELKGSLLGLGRLVGQSQVMQKVYDQIILASNTDANVLLCGDTGTGKDLVALTIHERSSRSNCAFSVVNCATLSSQHLQSELFGCTKGRMEGATEDQLGLFETADGGTLFLDEIASASPQMQANLLQVIETGKFRRIGESQLRQVNVRIIASTNQHLASEMAKGRFRKDLYYRLQVFKIELPCLVDRKDDIPLLAKHLFSRISLMMEKRDVRWEEEVLDALMAYDWPGNVRELENEIYRLSIATKDVNEITVQDLSPQIQKRYPVAQGHLEQSALRFQLEACEKKAIQNALRICNGNVGQAAKQLEISRSGLYQKIMRYEIVVDQKNTQDVQNSVIFLSN